MSIYIFCHNKAKAKNKNKTKQKQKTKKQKQNKTKKNFKNMKKKTQHNTVWTDLYFTEHENKHYGGASVVCIQELSGQLAFEHIKMFIYNNFKLKL